MQDIEYRFGDYRLVAAARELHRGSEIVATPRLVFDCLLYLIEHRDRAVGRDELTAAVWGRVDASDGQINQLMLRVRRMFEDDDIGNPIRTVPGFGYRWIAAVETSKAMSAIPAPKPVTAAPAEPDAASANDPTAGAENKVETKEPSPRRRWIALTAALALAALLCLALIWRVRPASTPEQPFASGIAVLPLQVEAPKEAAWVRLGVMDLVAERLRSGGLAVPPSENVLLAVGNAGDPLRPDARNHLQQVLGTSMLVEGKATLSERGWKVELSAGTSNGSHYTRSEGTDVIDTAREATDQLLAALGRVPARRDETDDVREPLQQVSAALLAGELDTAHTILGELPQTVQADPRIRLKLAQVDARFGHLDEAAAAYTRLLDDPAVQADPLLRGRVLMSRGAVHGRRTDFAAAEHDFDTAVAALRNSDAPIDFGRALNQRGVSRTELHRYDEAAADLGQARLQFQQAGDRLGLIQSNTNLGLLEAERGRMEQALPYLRGAADDFEAFGAPERMLAVLVDVFDAETALLHWPEALATTERQLAHIDRAGDPGLAMLASVNGAVALTGLGRLREADDALTEAQRRYGALRAEATRHLAAARAELAWRRGQAADAAAASDQAIALWPARDPGDAARARLVLLRQRAHVATGSADAATIERELPPDGDGFQHAAAALKVAVAEWAAHRGRSDEAEGRFREALANAEASGVPADIALAAAAYTEWLLAHGRSDDAGAPAGRVAVWADRDFDCALLQVAVLHARGQKDAWANAVRQAKILAGERAIPARLLTPPRSEPLITQS